jgi:hypothetical protein
MEDLKDTLKGQIKKSVTAEIDQLKIELAKLKDYRDNLQKYENEMVRLKYQLKVVEESVEKRAKELRLKDVMELIEKPAYLIKTNPEYIASKCDKCDNDRMIHFTSPSGKDLTEPCPYCNKRKWVSYPTEGKILEISDKHYEHYEKPEMQGIQITYAIPEYYLDECLNRERDVFYYTVTRAFDGKDFSKYTVYELKRLYYRNIEDCQKACDYINNKEEE